MTVVVSPNSRGCWIYIPTIKIIQMLNSSNTNIVRIHNLFTRNHSICVIVRINRFFYYKLKTFKREVNLRYIHVVFWWKRGYLIACQCYFEVHLRYVILSKTAYLHLYVIVYNQN